MDNRVNTDSGESRTLTKMTNEAGQLQRERPQTRRPASGPQSQPFPMTQVQQDQPTASRKVSLNPGGGVRDLREDRGAGVVSFGRNISPSALEQTMHHQQSTMAFHNVMLKGSEDYGSFGFADGGHPVSILNPIHDPMISDWQKHHFMGTCSGGAGGSGQHLGDSLMNFPSPSLLLSHRRGNTSRVGGDANDVAVGLGASKPRQYYPQQQRSFAGDTTNQHLLMMDDRMVRPHLLSSTALTYKSLDATAGIAMETCQPSRHRLATKSHSGTRAQQQQALILQLQSRQSIKKKERAPSSTSFPVKLYKILCDPKYHDVVTWLPHGRAWRVLKPKSFEQDVIPKFFRSDRYASFMRQVNGWGFKRITEGPDLNSYYHEMFLRGLPKVAAKMRRPQKGEIVAISSSKEFGQHPDFYKISRFAPLPIIESESKGDRDAQNNSKMSSADVVESNSTQVTVQRNGDEEVPSKSSSNVKHSSATGAGTAETSNLSSDAPTSPASGKDSNKAYDSVIAHSTDPTSAAKNLFHSPDRHHIHTLDLSGKHTHCQADQSSPGLAGARELVDEMAAASPGSIHSWNEPRDQDLSAWAGTPIYGCYPSPAATRQEGLISGFNTPSNLYEVTPPSQLPSPHGGGGRNMPPVMPHGLAYRGDGNDDSGLSEADLCYLTEQNRILLQAQGEDVHSIP